MVRKQTRRGGGKSTWRPPLDMSCRFGSAHGRQDVQLYTHAAKNDLRVTPQYAKGTQKGLQGDSTIRKKQLFFLKNSVLEQPGPSKLTSRPSRDSIFRNSSNSCYNVGIYIYIYMYTYIFIPAFLLWVFKQVQSVFPTAPSLVSRHPGELALSVAWASWNALISSFWKGVQERKSDIWKGPGPSKSRSRLHRSSNKKK